MLALTRSSIVKGGRTRWQNVADLANRWQEARWYAAEAITRDHVLPNIAGLLAVQMSTQFGFAILIEAGLSFLGLSVPPPTPGWGRMLNDAQTYLAQAPWMALAPGAAIAVAVLGFNLLGDGLRDWLDPRTRPEAGDG